MKNLVGKKVRVVGNNNEIARYRGLVGTIIKQYAYGDGIFPLVIAVNNHVERVEYFHYDEVVYLNNRRVVA